MKLYMQKNVGIVRGLCFPKIDLDNKVTVVEKEKYLGVFMVYNGSDDEDTCRQMRGVYARGNILIKSQKSVMKR